MYFYCRKKENDQSIVLQDKSYLLRVQHKISDKKSAAVKEILRKYGVFRFHTTLSTFFNKIENPYNYIRIFDLIDKCRYAFCDYDGSFD
jgi:hypothetical protein